MTLNVASQNVEPDLIIEPEVQAPAGLAFTDPNVKAVNTEIEIKNLSDISDDLVEKYNDLIKDICDEIGMNNIASNLLNMVTGNAAKKNVEKLLAGLLHMGVGMTYTYNGDYQNRKRDAKEYDYFKTLKKMIFEGKITSNDIEKAFFPLSKVQSEFRTEFQKNASAMAPETRAQMDAIFGADNDVLMMPVNMGEDGEVASVENEIRQFMNWYNQEMREGETPLSWSPDSPNKTFTEKEDGQKIGGPKLMKLIRKHDWYLHQLIEGFGGIGSPGLLSTTSEDETIDSNDEISFNDLIKRKVEGRIDGLFKGRKSDTMGLINPNRPDDYRIVISRKPEHIAECSTNQIWDSCMNHYGPWAFRYQHLQQDAKYGSLTCMLVHKDDENCRYPLMRRSFKPAFLNGDPSSLAYKMERPYGVANGTPISIAFTNQALEFVNKHFNQGKTDTYTLPSDIYFDDDYYLKPAEQAVAATDLMLSDNSNVIDNYHLAGETIPEYLRKKVVAQLQKDEAGQDVIEAIDSTYAMRDFINGYFRANGDIGNQILEAVKTVILTPMKKGNSFDAMARDIYKEVIETGKDTSVSGIISCLTGVGIRLQTAYRIEDVQIPNHAEKMETIRQHKHRVRVGIK